MAVFPDRIVLKTSTASAADIEQAIEPGGSAPIIPGELVLGIQPGQVRLFSIDDLGNVVNFGGSSATLLGGLDDVNLANLGEGYILQYNSIDQLWDSVNNTVANQTDVNIDIADSVFSNENITIQTVDFFMYSGFTFANNTGIWYSNINTNFSGGSLQIAKTTDTYFALSNEEILIKSESGHYLFQHGKDANDDGATIELENLEDAKLSIRQSLTQLTDYTWTFPSDIGTAGQVLTVDSQGNTYWSAGPAPDLSSSSLSAIGDVSVADVTIGQGIEWNGINWVPVTFPDSLPSLDDCEEVDLGGNDEAIQINYEAIILKNRYDRLSEWTTGIAGWQIEASYWSTDQIGFNNYIGSNASKGTFAVVDSAGATLRLGKWTGGELQSSGVSIQNYVDIKTSAATNSYALTLPIGEGLTNQVLGTDGNGQLQWQDTFSPTITGTVDITATGYNTSFSLSGETIADGSAPLVVVPGMQYRIDNQTGQPLYIVTSNNFNYDEGISNNGTTGTVIAWNVAQNVPATLYFRTGSSTYEIQGRGQSVNLSSTSIGSLEDVDTTTSLPSTNQALVWDGSQWVPKPVVSEEGQVYLEQVTWKPESNPVQPQSFGEFFYEIDASGVNKIILYPVAFNGTNYSPLFNQLSANETKLWLRLTTTDSTNFNPARTATSGLIPTIGVMDNNGNFELTWLENIAEFPIPGNYPASATDISMISVTLVERKLVEIPVFSVNGQTEDVVLYVENLEDVYIDQANNLDNGFPWIKGSSGNNGQYEIITQGNLTPTYNVKFANLDSGLVNRREQMLQGVALYVRQADSGIWINANPTSVDVSNVDIITYEGISQEAQLVLSGLNNSVIYAKFQPTQTEGYLLQNRSILQYDIADQKWKPADPDLAAGVISVNGLSGEVELYLQNLLGVNNGLSPTAGQALVFDGVVWDSADVASSVDLSQYSINALGDVNTQTPPPTNGQVLTWNESAVQWEPGTPEEAAPAIIWEVTPNGSAGYIFDGPGFPSTGSANNPTLYVLRGQKYSFTKNTDAHPFQLQTQPGTGESPYTTGVDGSQPLLTGTIEWTVPMDAPDELFYQCTSHTAMFGAIVVGGGGSGSVQSINNIQPDEDGNIELGIGELNNVTYASNNLEVNDLETIRFNVADPLNPPAFTRQIFSYNTGLGLSWSDNTATASIEISPGFGVILKGNNGKTILRNGGTGETTLEFTASNFTTVSFTTSANSTNQAYILPETTGAAGEVLTVAADGSLSWSATGGGSVSSVNGQTGVVVLSLNDIEGVDYTSGELDIPGLNQIEWGITSPTDPNAPVYKNFGGSDQIGFEIVDAGGAGPGQSRVSLSLTGALDLQSNAGDFLFHSGTGTEPTLKLLNQLGATLSVTVPANLSNTAYTLPASDGTSTQVLSTNGAGQLYWAEAGSGGGGGGGGALGALGKILNETLSSNEFGHCVAVDMGFWGNLVRVSSVGSAWITLYPTAAYRTADASRPFDTEPAPGSGVLAGFYVEAGQSVLATPGTTYFNDDTVQVSALYVAVRDKQGNPVQTDITLVGYGAGTYTSINGGTFG